MSVSQKIALLWALAVTFIIMTVGTIHRVRRGHRSYIQVVSYCFSFSFIVTIFVAIWANRVGAIDAQGLYHGKFGDLISYALEFTLDLNGELVIILALWSLLILPQLLSYVISGIFGCASDLILFRQGSVVAFWILVKSFSAASGVVAAIGPIGYLYSWNEFTPLKVSLSILVSALLIFIAFGSLFLYVDFKGIFNNRQNPLLNLSRRVHKWATRTP